MTDEQYAEIADLWFNQDYSPIDIGQELSLSMDDVEKAIRLLEKINTVIRKEAIVLG